MSRKPYPWRLISICLLVVGGSVCRPAGAVADENIEGVRHFLRATYSNPRDAEKGDESGIKGPHFYAQTKIDPIRFEALESLLPNTTFYKTHIDRADWDFQTVDLIASRTHVDHMNTYEVQFNVMFNGVRSEFSELFVGLKLDTPEKQLAFAQGYGKILTSVTAMSTVEVVDAESSGNIRLNFYNRKRLWRIIDIKLDQQDRIASIQSQNPSKRKAGW